MSNDNSGAASENCQVRQGSENQTHQPLHPIAKIDWANHFLDDWKYRHEAFSKITYRYIWVLVVLAILPLIPLPAQISVDFLQHVRHGLTLPFWVYWGFVLLVFICTSWHLTNEYRYMEEVRIKLQRARGIPDPDPEGQEELQRQRQVRAISRVYRWSFILFCLVLIVVPRMFDQSSLTSQMAGNAFTVEFNQEKFPDDCSIKPSLAGAKIHMGYDQNNSAWRTAAAPGSQFTVTPSGYPRYTPDKHLLIIEGAGFWFDDDKQVYRSCGNYERAVGKITFQ